MKICPALLLDFWQMKKAPATGGFFYGIRERRLKAYYGVSLEGLEEHSFALGKHRVTRNRESVCSTVQEPCIFSIMVRTLERPMQVLSTFWASLSGAFSKTIHT